MKKFTMTLLLLVCIFAGAVGNNTDTPLKYAKWISAPRTTEEGMPVFRKSFVMEKDVKDIVIHSSALGVYELYVNGERIGDEQLAPGWTDYRKVVQYDTHHYTKRLQKGDTLCVAAQTSNGWWTGGIARDIYGKNVRKAFLCSIGLTYEDGTGKILTTDTSWRCSSNGALRMGDIYNGETYDARLDGMDVMSLGNYDDSKWNKVEENDDHKGRLEAPVCPPVRIRHEKLWRFPKKITVYEGSVKTDTDYGRINIVDSMSSVGKGITIRKGQTMLVDFGQNLVGWIDMSVTGDTGTEVTWRMGEMLNYNGDSKRLDKGPAGSLWTWNLRTAQATIKYTINDKLGIKHYHPSHSFFGFRYAELTATSDVCLHSLCAQVVGTDIEEWGEFECSNADVNQLYSNIWWGQRGNFLSIPTDCPQRDERLGWSGDTQIFAETALFNSNAASFYRKWMGDMRASQREDGAYPETAPFCNMWGYGTAAWGDAGVIVPWKVYLMTGDKTIIEENWESMCRWIEFCANQREGEWTHIGAETKTGDWLAYRLVDARYVAYAYFAYSTQLMQKMALATGRDKEADAFGALHDEIRSEFQRRYVTDGRINTGQDTQTAYLLALHFGLLEEGQRTAAIDSLRKNIEDNGYRLSTGFVGTAILMQTLTECGLTDLAYRLLLQRKNPSWLYSIDQGATTVWERWDSYTIEGGFNKHEWNMNSFNHYSYGAVAEWFYTGILGIQPDEDNPGFRHIRLDPQVGGGLTYAKGGTMTPHGRVQVEWEVLPDETIRYAFLIPSDCCATLRGKTYGPGKWEVNLPCPSRRE